jgi:predicted transcriptional regulator
MHFNIYLDDATGARLNELAQQAGQTRNALIRQAVRDWLDHRLRPHWPEAVRDFEGEPDLLAFEAGRDATRQPAADPLG